MDNSIKNNNYKLGLLMNILIFFMSLMIVFVSQDPNILDQLPRTIILQNFFMYGFIHKHFSIFQFTILLISFCLLYQSKFSFKNIGFKEKLLIFSTIIYIVLLMLNPNNNTLTPIFGMPLFSDPSLYVGFIFMFTLFYSFNKDVIVKFLYTIGKYILIISAFRALLLLFLFLTGNGNNYMGSSTILMEEDTLLLFVLLNIISLALFFIKKDYKFLFLWALFFLVQILSFRRSGFMLIILCNISLFSIFFFGKMNLFKRISFLLLACFTMLSFFWALENYDSFTPQMKLYANRYFGQYYKFKDSYRYEREYRNLHIQQSNQSIEYISELPFWGFGYGKVESRNRKNFLGNTGIHNAYFALWEQFGLFALIYHIIIIIVFLNEILKTIMRYKFYPDDYFKIRVAVIIFFAFYLVNAWVLMIHNMIGIKVVFIRLLILSFLFYVTPENYNIIINRFNKKKS